MDGTILTFIKFNNMGQVFIRAICSTTQCIFEPPCVYEPSFNTDKYSTWFHGGGTNKENPTIIYYITKDHIAMHTIFFKLEMV